MTKFQIAYKMTGDEKELTFEIVTAVDIIQALITFDNRHRNSIIYSVLRCGKP